MNFSFIDEDNDKILNYEEVKNEDNDENNEVIESFTPGQNNPSNMNNPGTNIQHPNKPPIRPQRDFPKPIYHHKPNYQHKPHHKPHYQQHYRPPPQNNTYVYDTVVYDRPRRNYYDDYAYNPYYNPYFNPYFAPKEVEVVEVEKNKENNDSKNDSKKNEINITNLLLFIIIIIGLFFLMKKN